MLKGSQQQQDKAQLAVAYYNVGAEHQHLLQHEQAVRAYSRGLSVACLAAGRSSSIAQQLRLALQSSKQQPLFDAGAAARGRGRAPSMEERKAEAERRRQVCVCGCGCVCVGVCVCVCVCM